MYSDFSICKTPKTDKVTDPSLVYNSCHCFIQPTVNETHRRQIRKLTSYRNKSKRFSVIQNGLILDLLLFHLFNQKHIEEMNVYFMSLFFARNVTCLIRNYSIIIRMRRKYFFIIYIVTISTGIIIEKYRFSRNQAPWKNHS